MANILYDIIVLGASKAGIKAAEAAKNAFPKKTVCILSKNFDKLKTKPEGIDTHIGEVIFSTYNHGMVILTLADRSNALCQRLIIATGKKYADFWRNYTGANKSLLLTDINEACSRHGKAILVVGDGLQAADYATKLADSFEKIYVCGDKLTWKYPKRIEAKLSVLLADNRLTYLGGSHVLSVSGTDTLQTKLDTYATLQTDCAIAVAERVPDTGNICSQFFDTDAAGYIVVNEHQILPKVPNIMAVGEVIADHNDVTMVDSINKLF